MMIATLFVATVFCASWFSGLGGYALCEYHYRLMGRRRNDDCDCDAEQTAVVAELKSLVEGLVREHHAPHSDKCVKELRP